MRQRAAHSWEAQLPIVIPWASLVLLASAGAVYITRLRRALWQVGRARDQIVEAAHDLKTPLTVIRGEAQFLRRLAPPIEQRARLLTGLTRIDAAVGTMLGLLNELLD